MVIDLQPTAKRHGTKQESGLRFWGKLVTLLRDLDLANSEDERPSFGSACILHSRNKPLLDHRTLHHVLPQLNPWIDPTSVDRTRGVALRLHQRTERPGQVARC